MKFLLDRCAGHRLAEWLRSQGHDVVESKDLGPDPGDRVLLDWAYESGRVLVTLDKDFGEFLYVELQPHSGLVRLPDLPAQRRIEIMEEILRCHGRELSDRAVITVRGGRIRISRT